VKLQSSSQSTLNITKYSFDSCHVNFSRSILLMCMRARNMVGDAYTLEERGKLLILTPPVGLNRKIFSIKLSLNKSLKIMKFLKHI
jgi:hypothetical protein